MWRNTLASTSTERVEPKDDMLTEEEIRDQAVDYLVGRISLGALSEWLTYRSWDMHLDSTSDAEDLASAIELRLAEFSEEHLLLKDLRQEIADLISKTVVSNSPPPASASSSDIAVAGAEEDANEHSFIWNGNRAVPDTRQLAVT